MRSDEWGPNPIELIILSEEEKTQGVYTYWQRKGHVWTQQEGGHLQAKERGLWKTQVANNLDLGLLGSQTAAAAAAAATKSLQSCPTLCDPIDGSPPGSPVPGIFQARTPEWVTISFSSAWKWKVKVKSLSRVWLFTTPWTTAYEAPPSMRFSRQEYWSGLPLPSPGSKTVRTCISV